MSSRRARAAARRACRARAAHGAFLVEALVSIVLVSIAAAGLFILIATAIRASGDAIARAEAADLAASTLGRMASENPLQLADRYAPLQDAPGFAALAAAARRLPGVSASANLPVVSIAPGPSANSRRVSVTVLWQSPRSPSPHRMTMTSVVAPR